MKSIFSQLVPEYLEPEKSCLVQIIKNLLDDGRDQQIQPLLNPTPEDIDTILSSTPEIRSFCIEKPDLVNGILYIPCTLGGIRAEYRNNTSPKSVATDILIRYRHHWHKTRGIDPAPFISLITDKKLIIAVPVSKLGYKTLASIQAEQLALAHKKLSEQSKREINTARALENFKNRK